MREGGGGDPGAYPIPLDSRHPAPPAFTRDGGIRHEQSLQNDAATAARPPGSDARRGARARLHLGLGLAGDDAAFLEQVPVPD